MKNIYTKIFLLFSFILQLYLPERLNAQCLCAAGVPATAVPTQVVTIPPTASSMLNFTFQQFNPAIGTLSCLTLTDSISGISYSGARNTNIGNDTTGGTMHIDSTPFLFSLTLLSKITGPGISSSQPFNTTYGYDKLRGRDTLMNTPGDSITYGPTNFITKPADTVHVNGPSSLYLGTGTVDFKYTINGGLITMDGGANYKSSVTSIIGGTLALTYYYCPLSLLATGLQNFSAFKKDKNIVLTWDAQNAADISQYIIEYSIDGITFFDVAKVAANHNAATNTYNYNYALNGNSSGYVYFRIKQTGNDGKTSYSSIQKISLTDKSNTGISIRPNPAVTGISLTFDHPLSGDYSVDLVNTAGQVVLNKKLKLANSNTIPVNWSNKPAPGVYFTRVTNTGSMEQQIIRVVIQ